MALYLGLGEEFGKAPITPEEVMNAMGYCCMGKAPGLVGLPYQL